MNAEGGLVDAARIEEAAARIADIIVETPVVRSRALETERGGGDVFLKLESLQVTGSFKVRGAASAMGALSDDARERGVITCSSGNHGRAVAYVGRRLGIGTTVCVPEWVDPAKLAAIAAAGAEIVRSGSTFDEAERQSFALRAERDASYVSAFDDLRVIEGQGTIGRELLRQVDGLDTVVVPLSGGGLIAGVALAVRQRGVRVVAASARAARVMYESVQGDRPVVMDEEPTLATALAGGIGPENRYTFSLVRDLVDQHVLVSEEEIADAMRFAALEHHLILEGGGATALAAVRSAGNRIPGERLGVVLSGGNIDLELWHRVVAGGRT